MGDAYMPQKSFKDHRITLWSWFSPSLFTWELKDHTHVIRLGQQALYSLSHLTGSRTFDLV